MTHGGDMKGQLNADSWPYLANTEHPSVTVAQPVTGHPHSFPREEVQLREDKGLIQSCLLTGQSFSSKDL